MATTTKGFISVTSKVFNRVILDCLQVAADQKPWVHQAGFSKDSSYTDHIATLSIIIEQSIEWNMFLYMNFIDFKKAFDSLDHIMVTDETLESP